MYCLDRSSLSCPDFLSLIIHQPCIHSVSLDTGMVSVNRKIPVGLLIRCPVHWFRCFWRVPWENGVHKFCLYTFRRKVSSTWHFFPVPDPDPEIRREQSPKYNWSKNKGERVPWVPPLDLLMFNWVQIL